MSIVKIRYSSVQVVTGNTLILLAVMECKKGAVSVVAEVEYSDEVDPSQAKHFLVTTLTYYDAAGNPCAAGVYVRGDPMSLGHLGTRDFSLASPSARSELGAAAADVRAFTVYERDEEGNFVQTLLEAARLPPISFNNFLNQIIRNDDEAGSYQLLAGLFDDSTQATGTRFDDKFDTGGGDDTILGGGGNDTVYKWKGGDLDFSGGAGSDSLIFEPAGGRIPNPANGVRANLTTGEGRNPFGGTLTLASVENVSGTINDDILIGNAAANFLYSGHGGSDRIRALDGEDSVLVDHNFGVVQANRYFDGGAGTDTLTIYADAVTATGTGTSRFDLTDQIKNSGSFAGAVFLGFEKFVFLTPGSAFYGVKFIGSDAADEVRSGAGADSVDGRSGADRLFGLESDDRLTGGQGNDLIDGGRGDDVLRGNGGADIFVFGDSYGSDEIADFDVGEDRIDVSGLTGIASFGQLQSAATDVAGGVLISAGGGTLLVKGVVEADLSAGDFMF